MSKWFKDLYK